MEHGSHYVYRFGSFQLDSAGPRLLRGPDPVSLPGRQLRILLVLVTHAGAIVPKEALIQAVWSDVAVTDNSLETAVSGIRKTVEPVKTKTGPRRVHLQIESGRLRRLLLFARQPGEAVSKSVGDEKGAHTYRSAR
jgi:DNA-binding response OmpR family regulator